MNNLLGQFEYKSDVEPHWMHKNANCSIGCVGHDCDECKGAPSKTEIIKTLHQELLVKELRIKELEAANAEIELYKNQLNERLSKLSTSVLTIEQVKKERDQLNVENIRLTVAMNKYSEDEVLCQTKLAASQLREKVLREALDEVLPCCDLHCIGGMEAYRKGIEAISQPTDDSALREFVADEMVNMIDNCYPHECRDYAERYRKCEV